MGGLIAAAVLHRECLIAAAKGVQQAGETLEVLRYEVDHLSVALHVSPARHHARRHDHPPLRLEHVHPDDQIPGARCGEDQQRWRQVRARLRAVFGARRCSGFSLAK
ncbi:MAG TPA: hypothetical protein VMA86_01300 [Acetobacteraceae bacterium]|nr:hypothetical protein [Acetobacteraceae bacterium]